MSETKSIESETPAAVAGAARGSAKRNGNWIDEWGACKVCDGEIPHGHTDNCDIYKLECEITRLRHALRVIADTGYNNYSHQTMRDAAMKALSPNAELRHGADDNTTKENQ